MTKQRPASLTVFAILNLVFGGLGLLCNVCGLASLAITPMLQKMAAQQQAQVGNKGGFDPQELQRHMEANIPAYVPFQWGQITLGMILSVALIIGGIGLLRMSPAAKWVCAGYAVVTISYQVGSMAFTLAFINPVMNDWMKSKGVQVPMEFFAVASIIGGLVGMTYSLVLLIFIMLPSTGKALAANGADDIAGGSGGDYYESDFERRRRELPPES